ncbi:hypothetical protein Z517_00613 [Fonsecaea pedrosoi CBS 271.37]|uniref:Protein kinase domain-containing protein n=1 Tax=Fonsecaea pedrosoi CBS 271.37 TaxID=1442368 RepID=A0A0D2GW47_9EURO|nr:uncharacterized protein Z517_00613 [Fonsecaea pedrosoi CBS 271.37]KIW85223.1 hypothetical protein Z517_00613 [Fonsecaea pedrosoi CBS 271.37]
MSTELDRLRQLLQEERRLREEETQRRVAAESQAKSEQTRREEEQRRREEEQTRREEEQQHFQHRTGKTNLPEFLDACHVYLYQDLKIQDKSESTQGTPANADRKLRPDRIVRWHDFAECQTRVWDVLMQSDTIEDKHYTSRHSLQEHGEQLHRRRLSSELDVHYFVRFAINEQVSSIVEQLSQDPHLRQSLNLRGNVIFENHGNMLSVDDLDLENLDVTQPPPRRRSPRLRKQADQTPLDPPSSSASRTRSSIPRADQFGVHHIVNEANVVTQKIPILVMEYKAAHKLTLGHIYTGLGEMDLDDIVQERLDEDVTRRCQRLVAAVLTQTFAYMIAARVELGCVFTGEAFIFLRIPEDDCYRLEYALAVPHGDVGPSTGWHEQLDQDNRLHLTAVGQLLAFTVNAVQSPRRSLRWQRDAERQLQTWQLEPEELGEDMPEIDVPGSEYRPPLGEDARFLVESPVRRRLRPRTVFQLDNAPSQHSTDTEEDSGGENGKTAAETPSRGPQQRRRGSAVGGSQHGSPAKNRGASNAHPQSGRQRDLGPYCSAQCLKGMLIDGPLDPTCPNVHRHAKGSRHMIGLKRFRRSVRRIWQEHLEYCEELGLYGARGCLYRIRLPSWGYTMMAKGTRQEFIADLKREAAMYQKILQPVQGTITPVYLGSFTMQRPLHYMGQVPIVHMMLMSFGGYPMHRMHIPPGAAQSAIDGLRAIHRLGILHHDIARRNMLWDPVLQRVIWLDFERAQICQRRPLMEKSVNENKMPTRGKAKRTFEERASVEVRKVRAELNPTPPGP